MYYVVCLIERRLSNCCQLSNKCFHFQGSDIPEELGLVYVDFHCYISPYIFLFKCCFSFLLKDLQFRSWRYINCCFKWLWCSKGMPYSSKWNFCRQTVPSFIHEDDKNGRYVYCHLFSDLLNYFKSHSLFYINLIHRVWILLYWLIGNN